MCSSRQHYLNRGAHRLKLRAFARLLLQLTAITMNVHLVLLLFSVTAVVSFSPDEENWTDESDPEQVNSLESDLQTMLERVSGAPGLQQVFSLMGKRSARSQITRRRQKFQTFVGLMGKRNVPESGPVQETL